MIPIIRNEITAGKYYLVYLNSKFGIGKDWCICRALENTPCFYLLIGIHKSINTACYFGENWEIFEISTDEILNHIVLESI